MQQSRLDKFFIIKKSATTSQLVDNDNHSSTSTSKRLATTDNENNKKLKRTKSDSNSITNEENSQSSEIIENTFSLNQFYLDKFLLILSSLLKHHKSLFDENELILFDKFQTLSGSFFLINLLNKLFI
jgi:hypothetical protein